MRRTTWPHAEWLPQQFHQGLPDSPLPIFELLLGGIVPYQLMRSGNYTSNTFITPCSKRSGAAAIRCHRSQLVCRMFGSTFAPLRSKLESTPPGAYPINFFLTIRSRQGACCSLGQGATTTTHAVNLPAGAGTGSPIHKLHLDHSFRTSGVKCHQ